MNFCLALAALLAVQFLSLSGFASAEPAPAGFSEAKKSRIPGRAAGGCPSGATPAPPVPKQAPCDCHLVPEQSLFSQTAAELEQETDTSASPTAQAASGPARQSGKCGLNTLLSDTLERGQVEIPAANGVVRFVPLFLGDKSKFYCVAIRPWTPCLLGSKTTANGIELTFGTDRRGLRKARIFVSSDFDRRKITSSDENFVLLRRKVPEFSMVKDGDTIKEARRFADQTVCSSEKGPAQCRRDKQWALERRILQILRVERKPIGAKPGEADADLARFDTSILAKLDTPAQRLSALAIVTNEIGYRPNRTGLKYTPYEVLDAGGPSGLSFGYFQVDIATNSPDERAPFRSILAATAKADPADKALRHISDHRWFEQRVQSFSADVLLAWFRSTRPLYETARSPDVRSTVDAQMLQYAKRTSGCLGLLARRGPPFQDNPVARLYVLDIANHFGADALPAVIKAAEQATSDPLKAMLDELVQNSSYGKLNRSELQNRVDNIAAVVAGLPANERNSFDNTDCGIKVLRQLPVAQR
jgi:hypothetical protein